MMTLKQQKQITEAADPANWKWFGFAAHLCVGQWCRFHLATQVGPYLVSTVGHFVHPRFSAGSEKTEQAYLRMNPQGEEVGYNRFYETMVFRAGTPCTQKGCDCGMPDTDGSSLDMNGYNTSGAATAGHMAMCLKWSKQNCE